MAHFTREAVEGDPEGVARLHEILHGRETDKRPKAASAASLPTLEERFGVRNARQNAATPHPDPVAGILLT